MNIDGIDIPLAVEHAGTKAIDAYVAAIKAGQTGADALIAAGVTKPDPVTAADAAAAPVDKKRKG